MANLVAVMSLALLVFNGVESCSISEKAYENAEKILEFGAQMFLNSLDKLRDLTERMVKDNQQSKSRIAIQDHWNSFKEKANRIHAEERGKGEEDYLVIAARTIRRLALFYMDDVQEVFHSLTKGDSVQLYLPPVFMWEGVIQRKQLNEIWGAMESHYFPGVPSISKDPLKFLCYPLSTDTVGTFSGNILKTATTVVSEIRKVDFHELQYRLQNVVDAITEQATEFANLERKNEKEELLVSVSAATRTLIFYWDRFLKFPEIPEIEEKYKEAQKVYNKQIVFETISEPVNAAGELIGTIFPSSLPAEVFWLHAMYFEDIYDVITNVHSKHFADNERWEKTAIAFGNINCIIIYAPVWEKLTEMNVFPSITRQLHRAKNITEALAEEEDFNTFRDEVNTHLKAFVVEAERVLKEEKEKSKGFMVPQVRAAVRLLSNYLHQLIKVNIDQREAEETKKNLEKIRKICTEKLLASGLIH